MTQLAGQVDAHNTDKMRDYLVATIPGILGLPKERVAVSITTGDDSIGIAAMSRSGVNAATSGAKADCVANPKMWAAARCNEITAQWPIIGTTLRSA